MTYIQPINPEADSRRQSGEYLGPHYQRATVIEAAVRFAEESIRVTERRSPDTTVAAVTSIATGQLVSAEQQLVATEGTTDQIDIARANVAAVLAGTEQPGEIQLSATPQPLDHNYIPQLERQAA